MNMLALHVQWLTARRENIQFDRLWEKLLG
jgi:hypothetical protein